ncbi:hypothetical protein J2847_000939 [Azospirillum agricola]|uniref:hypothetical protein n=1 Tax=Azospirillum agricola TaxID=1720247 RepID=UPI001AE631E4|nr:hypothetical protein [Azospirillum agricola]MBP2227657.1 hypothetical protein [Azospirillum agricola]
MMPEDIARLVREACSEIAEGVTFEDTGDGEGMSTGFLVGMDGGEGDAESFSVTFGINAPAYEGTQNREYLTISWWIPGEQMLSASPLGDPALFPMLNELNREPGIKCRLDLDENRNLPNDFIVVETELLTHRLDRRAIVHSLDRLLDFVSYHAAQMRRHLTAELDGLQTTAASRA